MLGPAITGGGIAQLPHARAIEIVPRPVAKWNLHQMAAGRPWCVVGSRRALRSQRQSRRRWYRPDAAARRRIRCLRDCKSRLGPARGMVHDLHLTQPIERLRPDPYAIVPDVISVASPAQDWPDRIPPTAGRCLSCAINEKCRIHLPPGLAARGETPKLRLAAYHTQFCARKRRGFGL